jgi:hypothetical protein
MDTKIHGQIDELLAAEIHDQLKSSEQAALHAHLVECAECRQLHKEQKNMNKLLQENYNQEKVDETFEQRMLSGFRNRVPQRSGFARLLSDLMRLRAIQISAAAALLLALVQIGHMLTREDFSPVRLADAHSRDLDELTSLPRLTSLSRTAPDRSAAGKDDQQSAIGGFESGSVTSGARIVAAPSAQEQLSKSGQLQAARRSEQRKAPAQPFAPNETEVEAKAGTPAELASATEPGSPANSALANRKLVRNAEVDLEVIKFDDALQKITTFAAEDGGYIATTSSEKQQNGKLRGEVVVKVLPDNLDRFLGKLRALGELKNQSISTEDVTKAYFDTDSRLKNARVMEQRLIEILKKKSEDVNDLLQVEKELGRVREEIERMQGDLKFMDAQVQFATVTISLAEKEMNVPAAFLLKEQAQLSLYAPDVEKVYNDIKGVASAKVQITTAQLDRDNSGRVSARVSMLIAPEESEATVARVKGMGRVENFRVHTERVAQGGEGMSEQAKTERDKVQLNITLSREEQEQAFQQTSLRIRTGSVEEKAKELRGLAEKQNGRVRSSSFSRDPDGREYANVSLRVPLKNYNALIQSLDSLGKVENVAVQRQDQTGTRIDEANAPADVSVQVYSQGNVVSQQSGLFATLRRTAAQGVSALMWSIRMIGVALAFIAPWAIALAVVIWLVRRVRRSRTPKA